MEFINKSQIMQGIEPDSTADILEKGINHKYYKREGTPGNYKYYYTEEEYKKAKNPHDSRFKFQKDTKVSFVKNGETINGIISDYDYNSVTFDKEYNVDYKKDGKTWTMIGVPEGKIQEFQEDKKNLAKEIIERQKTLPKEDIGKKLEATTSIVEYRRHLIDYGTKNGDKDLVEYAKNASVSALERRMKSEKTEEQFQDKKEEKLSQYQQMMDEYEEKAKELKSLDGWKPSFIANSVYKNFGENSFINGGSIDAHFDIAKKETYFSVNVGYNSFTHEEEQKKFFPKLYELRDKKFSTAKGAEDALNSFMSDWDKERSEILKKVKEETIEDIRESRLKELEEKIRNHNFSQNNSFRVNNAAEVVKNGTKLNVIVNEGVVGTYNSREDAVRVAEMYSNNVVIGQSKPFASGNSNYRLVLKEENFKGKKEGESNKKILYVERQFNKQGEWRGVPSGWNVDSGYWQDINKDTTLAIDGGQNWIIDVPKEALQQVFKAPKYKSMFDN